MEALHLSIDPALSSWRLLQAWPSGAATVLCVCRKLETDCNQFSHGLGGCQRPDPRRVIMLRRDNLSALEV